jgi:hypothetical protein
MSTYSIFICKVTIYARRLHPICCGIDVYKKFVVATIATTDNNNVTTYEIKQLDTYTKKPPLIKRMAILK